MPGSFHYMSLGRPSYNRAPQKASYTWISKTISRVMSRIIIYLDLTLPSGSSNLPEADGPPYASVWSCFGWGLHMPLLLPGRR